jgi:transcriptional regulator NrdR family protein
VAALDDEQKGKRTHEVRGDASSQGIALRLQLADETEVASGEIAEAAMEELR